MTGSRSVNKKDESPLITKLAEVLSKRPCSVEISAITPEGGFDKYYSLHRSGILKRPAWVLYAEEGLEFEGKSLDVGAYLHNLPRGSFPELTVKVPPKVLEELGFQRGDRVNHLSIFIEPLPPSRINLYVAKAHEQMRGITNAEWRRCEDKSYKKLMGSP